MKYVKYFSPFLWPLWPSWAQELIFHMCEKNTLHSSHSHTHTNTCTGTLSSSTSVLAVACMYQGFYVGKQIPQHSMQISRQSEDSQHASIMPQSMSQGQLQSSPRSSVQQQQQQASDVQVPHEAWATTILHRVINSQNRQARMQWTQQSALRVLQWAEQKKNTEWTHTFCFCI